MKIEYHNLYTHFILITQSRIAAIPEKNRERIEKYITGIVNNNNSRLYSIYANPEHVYFLASRSPKLSEEALVVVHHLPSIQLKLQAITSEPTASY